MGTLFLLLLAAAQTYTGCVDERDGAFVLTGDRELVTKAVLRGDGFTDDAFARHVGHKVKVEAVLSKEGDKQVLRVKKITTVSESCEPGKEK